MSGNLCYQIEHHLFPDLPSNRLPEIGERVRALGVTYDLPYTTGSFVRQYLLIVRTICKLALPAEFLSASCDDAPETASENKFRNVMKRSDLPRVGHDVRRRGLATALLAHRNQPQPGKRP
jgi:NADPH-dependent stearoyl-CoA 9-desaturase